MSYLCTFMCPVLQVDSFFEVNLLFLDDFNDYKTLSSADSLFHGLMIVSCLQALT